MTDGNPSILLRFSGELTTKGRPTRRRFESRLLQNLRAALAREDIDARIRCTRDRYFVTTERRDAAPLLARIFGVQSVAQIEVTSAERLESIVAVGRDRFAERVRGRRFAIRVRRVGNRRGSPVSSRDVAVALGDALRPLSAGVDLDNPEVEVRLEINGREAHWIEAEFPGPAGLPLGSEGRAVALVSGGFDSAVAAWQMLRRGVDLDLVFCNLGGDEHLRAVVEVSQILVERWCHGSKGRFHAVDFEAIAAQIRARVHPRYWQIVLKRTMLRAAEAVARERDAEAIVTGDAIGQVSSQTLRNLSVVSEACALPILRPLVGSNKDDIVRRAEAMGTAERSAAVEEYCAMSTSKPATAARSDAVAYQERELEPEALAVALEARAVFDLQTLDAASWRDPGLAVDRIDPGATVVDLRSKAAFSNWHVPGALRLDFDRALAAFESFDREARYVLYCEIGMKSAHLAERMRQSGFDAAHLAGGLRAAMRCAPNASDDPLAGALRNL